MDGILPLFKKDKPSPSPSDANLVTPPHAGGDAPRELSSSERRQYNKALRAMYEIVRLGSKRLEKPLGGDDDDNDDDDDDVIPEPVSETSDNGGDQYGKCVVIRKLQLVTFIAICDMEFNNNL